jgi:hypothetical protein
LELSTVPSPLTCSAVAAAVLGLVGARVFALRPLGDVVVIAVAHDRRPADQAAAVAGVVADAGGAVVRQAEVVAELVRAGLGDVGADVRAEVVGVDQRRRIVGVVVRRAEHVDVGDAAGAGRGHRGAVGLLVLGDQHAAGAAVEAGRLLGGDVDVERRQVLGDAVPDLDDGGALGVVERRAVAVLAEGQRVEGARAPGRAGEAVAVEVQVDLVRGARLAVQDEGIGRREVGAHAAGGAARGLRRGALGVGDEHAAADVHAQVVVVRAADADLLQPAQGVGLGLRGQRLDAALELAGRQLGDAAQLAGGEAARAGVGRAGGLRRRCGRGDQEGGGKREGETVGSERHAVPLGRMH